MNQNKTILSFSDFVLLETNGVDSKLESALSKYDFKNKISQNKNAIVTNAVNIKEVIHKACEWCVDNSGAIFMFEICIAETSLGVSSKSMATKGDIGRSLWHVDKGTFEWTKKSHSRINEALSNLKNIGIDWSLVEWNDISTNILLGAIACKLVLLKKGFNSSNTNSIDKMDKRAKAYATRYNAGGSELAETNYIKNCKAWYKELLNHNAEYLIFNDVKYKITENGLFV